MTLIQHTVDYLVAQSVDQKCTLNIDIKKILDFLDSQIVETIESV